MMFGKIWRITIRLVIGGSILLVWYSAMMITIGMQRDDRVSADAALVLGAAVFGERPSPLFRARIDHAVDLYKRGVVKKIVFTGGIGFRDTISEAQSAQQYALAQGVPPEIILIEEHSTSTWENFRFAKPLLSQNGIHSILVVTTPFHAQRALFVATQFGIEAGISSTRTTPWRKNGEKQFLFLREILSLLHYQLVGEDRS